MKKQPMRRLLKAGKRKRLHAEKSKLAATDGLTTEGVSRMQVNLVFGPFAKPRVPLGIALLKSYVEQNSNFQIKCFDLNALYHNDLCDDVGSNNSHVNISEQDKETLMEAVNVFKGGNEEFFNQAVYDSSASTLFQGCFERSNGFFDSELKKALSNSKHTPWFVNEYVNLLLQNKPDVVGFSIMFLEQISFSILAASMLKAANKDIIVVFGGNLSSTLYKRLLTPPISPFIDFVVRNEGEKAFLELLEAINRGTNLGEVPDLAFNNNGKVIATESSMITNLDDIPFPDFSDFDYSSYFAPAPVFPVLGSRGCYWRRCTFCVHHESYFNKYRVASVKHMVDELEFHIKNGITYFDLVDEMIPSGRFKQIAEEIIRRGLELHYFALAKPTADFTEDILELMYESGCRYILWGVESGCQRTLDLMDKGTNTKDIPKVLAASASAGIKNHVFIIIGFPSETEKDLRETLVLLYENKSNIHAIHGGLFTLHKGSLVYSNPTEFCITTLYDPDPLGDLDLVRYDVSQGLSYDELEQRISFYAENYFPYFSYFSAGLVGARDHALILYANPDKLIFNIKKQDVPLPGQTPGPEAPAFTVSPQP